MVRGYVTGMGASDPGVMISGVSGRLISEAGTSPYRLIDLFAGCGGMTLGFVQTGHFRSVLAVEVDPDAAATYELNFGRHVARTGEIGPPLAIADIPVFPPAEVVIGGPPCQGFSPLNMRGVGMERRGLWRDYVRALDESGASAFVMENVPELLKSQEFADFKARAEDLGFVVDARVLNAADYGVPQTRRRAIAMGVRGDRVVWPAATHREPGSRETSGLPEWRTFRDAVEGLPLRPSGLDWHNPRNPRPLSLQRYMTIPGEGEGRFDLAARAPDLTPACWLRKKSGSTDVFGRLWWDRPAFTIRTEFYKPEKGRYLHPSEHRPITVREAARLMTFPDAPTFRFLDPGVQSMTSVARQIGNAVPPLFAHALAEAVAEILAGAAPATSRVPAAA